MRERWLASAAVPVLTAVLWEAAVRRNWLDGIFFPAPTTIARTFAAMFTSGEIASNTGSTLLRMLTGFTAGSLAGIVCGAAMGISRWIRWLLEPLTAALNATPKLTLFPMLMLLAGMGETSRQILLAATAFVIVSLNTLDGVHSINPHFREMARNYGASTVMLWRRVYLPASAPYIFSGLRLAMGRVLVLAITVEMLGGSAGGLGSLVWTSWQTFAIERLYVAAALCGVLGLIIHRGLLVIETRFLPWRTKSGL